MRSPRPWFLVLLAVVATACHRPIPSLEPGPGTAAPLRLQFLPPEGALLTETVTRSLAHGAAPGVQEARMTTTTRFSAEPDGWLLTQHVVQAAHTRDGTPQKTWVDEVLVRAPLRARLSADGTFVRLVEPEAALAALTALAPAGVDVSPLERLFAPETLEARARSEWEEKYGGLHGRSLTPGQHTYAVGRAALGEHEVVYLVDRLFTGWRRTEYGEALAFSLRCLALPEEASPPEVRERLHSAGDPELTPGVECEGEQLLGKGRFLPVGREFTLRAKRAGDTWTWTTRSALESLRAPEEERK